MESKTIEMARRFALPQGEITAEPYGNGHINDTLCVCMKTQEGTRRYIMQRVNRYVFKRPEDVIANIARVTEYLRGIIAAEGGDPARETLTLVPTADGKLFAYDEDGELWRMYLFIEGTISRDLPDTPELFALSGAAFGRFQRQMGGFPAASLVESIPDFHNTPARYAQLMDAAARDEAGRLGEVAGELAFCKRYEREVLSKRS